MKELCNKTCAGAPQGGIQWHGHSLEQYFRSTTALIMKRQCLGRLWRPLRRAALTLVPKIPSCSPLGWGSYFLAFCACYSAPMLKRAVEGCHLLDDRLAELFFVSYLDGVRSFRRLHHSDASANINSAKCSFLCRIHRNTLPSSHHPHYPGRSAGRHSELVHCGIKRMGPVRPHGSHGLWVGCCATPLLELGESLHALARSVR